MASSPEGASAVGCRMLFDNKQSSGCCKRRLVPQGFLQVHSEDYGETYAPVAAMQTLRFLGGVCAVWIDNSLQLSEMFHLLFCMLRVRRKYF